MKEIKINCNWFSLEELKNLKESAKFLCRPKNETYKDCICICILDFIAGNDMWCYFNGQSMKLSKEFIENNEICGPIIFN